MKININIRLVPLGVYIFAFVVVFSIGALSSILLGVEFTDTGFMLGLSHRMVEGQAIYRDFDFVRPPLTPWLWHFPLMMDLEWPGIFIRLLVVGQKIAIGLLVFLSLRRCGITKATALFCGSLTTIFVMHHIPSEPWYTVDGIFFICVSIAAMSYGHLSLGFIFSMLAAATKQSFFPFPVFYLLIACLMPGRKTILLTFLPLSVAFGSWINWLFDLSAFTRISTGVGSFEQIYAFLVKPHIIPDIEYFATLIIAAALPLMLALRPLGLKPRVLSWARITSGISTKYKQTPVTIQTVLLLSPLVPVIIIVLKMAYIFCTRQELFFSIGGGTHVFMVASIVHMLIRYHRSGNEILHDPHFLLGTLFLIGAFCTTISWGYRGYVYGFGFLVAANVLFSSRRVNFQLSQIMLVLILVTSIFAFLRLLTPYRTESPLFESYSRVESGYYKNVYVSTRTKQLLESIQEIASKTQCFDFYPTMTSAGLLGQYIPPLRVDWQMDVEFPNPNEGLNYLKQNRCALFVEKGDIDVSTFGKSTMINLDEYAEDMQDYNDHFLLLDFNAAESRPALHQAPGIPPSRWA